jgi:hypothetical protein
MKTCKVVKWLATLEGHVTVIVPIIATVCNHLMARPTDMPPVCLADAMALTLGFVV